MGNFDKLHDLIATSASEVIEKMFYKKIVPVYDEDQIFPAEVIVNICFSGKYSGKFWIILSKSLCYELCASFLSMDASSLDDEIVHDTTKEIVNMVCGNILFNFDKDKKFDLTVPSIYVDTNAKDQILTIPNTSHTFNFKIAKHPLKMVLYLTAM